MGRVFNTESAGTHKTTVVLRVNRNVNKKQITLQFLNDSTCFTSYLKTDKIIIVYISVCKLQIRHRKKRKGSKNNHCVMAALLFPINTIRKPVT